MTYASVCSGIEAASVAWEPLGWRPAWFSEIEPFPSAVLAHRFPDVPNLGDMTKIKGDEHGAVDLLVGGTPCQDLSVAGKRMGFGGKRSVLALDFVRLAYECGAKWFVWENVPGVFSSNGGKDFAQLLSLFAGWQVDTPADGWSSFGIVEQSPGCFGLAWRVLDVQYARVDGFERAIPQRRRRVFIVGYLGDWRCAAQVLFEPDGLLGNSPPRREAREGTAEGAERCVAHSLRAQAQFSFREDTETIVFDALGNGDGVTCPTVTGDHAGRPNYYMPVVCRMTAFGEYETDDTASTMKQRDYKDATDLVVAVAFEPRFVRTTGGCPSDGLQPCLRADTNAGDGAPCVAIADVIHGDKSCNGKGWNDDGSAYTLDTMATQGVMQQTYVAFSQGVAMENKLLTRESESFNMKGIKQGDNYASTLKAYACSILSTLREKVGEEAFSEWRLRILEAIRNEKILQSWVHGESVRCLSEPFRHWVLNRSLSWEEGATWIYMRNLWEDGPDGRTPQGRELAKQLCFKPRDCLQGMPQQNPQETRSMQNMRTPSEGFGVLYKTLSEIQEVGGPSDSKAEPAHSSMSVRRLTPIETERLMGFPDDWTRIPWRNKPAEQCPDGPRYKACGNSMGVNVMRWIGRRIEKVEGEIK